MVYLFICLCHVQLLSTVLQFLVYRSFASCAKLLQSSLFLTVWTVARQAPLPMGFSRQEYWYFILFDAMLNAIVSLISLSGISFLVYNNVFCCCCSVIKWTVTPWTAACRLPCPSQSPRVCSYSCPLSQ